jgi:predicted MPP superfamily phosphohydrolase
MTALASALVALLAATYFSLLREMRFDRKELGITLVGIRGDIVSARQDIHEVAIVLARLDERVKVLEGGR